MRLRTRELAALIPIIESDPRRVPLGRALLHCLHKNHENLWAKLHEFGITEPGGLPRSEDALTEAGWRWIELQILRAAADRIEARARMGYGGGGALILDPFTTTMDRLLRQETVEESAEAWYEIQGCMVRLWEALRPFNIWNVEPMPLRRPRQLPLAAPEEVCRQADPAKPEGKDRGVEPRGHRWCHQLQGWVACATNCRAESPERVGNPIPKVAEEHGDGCLSGESDPGCETSRLDRVWSDSAGPDRKAPAWAQRPMMSVPADCWHCALLQLLSVRQLHVPGCSRWNQPHTPGEYVSCDLCNFGTPTWWYPCTTT